MDLMSVVDEVESRISASNDKYTDFDGSASTFAAVVGKQTYIDKSMFIKTVLDGKRHIMVTAPRRFGKTVNLNMLKCFVEIETDEDGNQKICDRRNRRLFSGRVQDGNYLKIMHDMNIVSGHFGKYPVVYADFTCHDVINSLDEALDACRRVIRSAYCRCHYLCHSQRLDEQENRLCERWICDDIKRTDITSGLRYLVDFLYKHHQNRRVFVLVDEYDSVIIKAMLGTDSKTLDKIVQKSTGILSAVLNDAETHVARAVITGTIPIATDGLHNITKVAFLRNNDFVEYYGLTAVELELLANRLEAKIDVDKIKNFYRGYVSENGVVIYPLWSVLNCLDKHRLGYYFEGTGPIDRLAGTFQSSIIRNEMQKLILGCKVGITRKTRFLVGDLIKLQYQLLSPKLKGNFPSYIMLTYLFEHGYLTYGAGRFKNEYGLDFVNVRLPNEEIKRFFCKKLAEYYIAYCKLDDTHRQMCKAALIELMKAAGSGDELSFDDSVRQFHKHFEHFVQHAFVQDTCMRLNESALSTAMCFIAFDSDFQFVTDYVLPNGTQQLNLAIAKFDCGIVFEFRCDMDHAHGTALEALNKVKLKKVEAAFASQRKVFVQTINTIVLIGISVNLKIHLGVCCEISGRSMRPVCYPRKFRPMVSPVASIAMQPMRRCVRKGVYM